MLAHTPLALPVPTRAGYIFEGWYTEKENGTKVGGADDEFTVNANLTLYALWSSNIYWFDTAQEITINEVVQGNLLSANKDDYYKISFNGSGEMNFLLQLSDNAKYNMYIYDADNTSSHIAHVGGAVGDTRLITRLVESKTYYIRIYAPNNDSIDATTEIGYSLQLTPTVANEVVLAFENSTHISDNTYTLSCVTTPKNAYTECKYISCNSDIDINENIITAVEDGVTIVTVTDACSNISDSRLLIFDLLPPNHTITVPTGKRCNWNQKHEGVTSLFGGSACTLVAGLDIANFYSTNESGYTPKDMDDSYYWSDQYGYYWRIPGAGYLKSEYTFTADSLKGIDFSIKDEYILQHYIHYIKKEIYNGRPVIINLGPNRDNNHSVVAYKYMDTPEISRQEDPTEMNKIQVFDPENGGDNTNIEGRDVTLWEAFRYNFGATNTSEFVLWSLRPTETN